MLASLLQESIPLDLDELEEMSPEEQPNQSDEDDWSGESSRRKRRKRQNKPTSGSRKSAGGGGGHSTTQTPIDPKPFICARKWHRFVFPIIVIESPFPPLRSSSSVPHK